MLQKSQIAVRLIFRRKAGSRGKRAPILENRFGRRPGAAHCISLRLAKNTLPLNAILDKALSRTPRIRMTISTIHRSFMCLMTKRAKLNFPPVPVRTLDLDLRRRALQEV